MGVVRGFTDSRIRVVPGPRAGFTPALNCGLRAARQPFVALCDSDDWWAPDRLDWQRRMIAEKAECIAVSGAFASATPEGRHVADLAVEGPSGDVTDILRNGITPTSFCTWLTRRSALETVGFARDWFEIGSDMDLQTRLAEVGRVWHEPRVCYHYRLHDVSVTHTHSAAFGAFFDDAVKRFARQRRETGTDDLMRGTPPDPPEKKPPAAPDNRARDQIRGHMTSQAWRHFEAGDRRAAFALMARALTMEPVNLSVWRGLGVMAVKTVTGRHQRP